MNEALFQDQRLLARRLLVVFFAYFICRLFFYNLNKTAFGEHSLEELVWIFIYGARFDIAAIVLWNLPVIALSVLPLPFRKHTLYQRLNSVLFFALNGFALLSNCGDMVYFRFTAKRTTADVFTLVGTGTDFVRLLPYYVRDFWYIFVLWAGFLFLLWQVSRPRAQRATRYSLKTFFAETALAAVVIALAVVGGRGGIQLKPLNILAATEFAAPRFAPLVLNTPYTLIRTFGKKTLSEQPYFPESELANYFSPVHPGEHAAFKPLNVVVIILESFSREYVGRLNARPCCTPFLDTLIDRGLVFGSAYANGKNSVDGIPAIVASLPSLMRRSYVFSPYSGNRINSLASLLGQKGYQSGFFHGGENGTMMFDSFARSAGFDRYFGRTEYANDADYDGSWGIWDEEFFQYAEKEISKFKSPFVAAIFSLSSHHPYRVPERLKDSFPLGTTQVERSIQYTDYSLRRFFEAAEKESWYKDTLFVLTADHTAESESPTGQSRVEAYQIPIVFFRPNGELNGRYDNTFQQIDILPTVLDFLNYDEPYFAFGESAFSESRDRIALAFFSDMYQLISGSRVLHFDGRDPIAFYDLAKDKLMENNALAESKHSVEELATRLKAFIQTYNHSLLSNRLTADAVNRPSVVPIAARK